MKNNRSLGQVFLKNNRILKILAQSLQDIHQEIVVEIGGGHGELTKFLLSAKKIIVYEIDKKLSELLKQKFPQACIINENFLNANLKQFKNNYLLIGNIPYSITGKILRKILDEKNHPKIAVLTLQKEYGDKILGVEGTNFLNILTKIWCVIEKIINIKRTNFFPTPKVNSLALKFTFYPQPLIKDTKTFEFFLKNLFSNQNKMLKNNDFFVKIFPQLGKEQIAYKRPSQLTFDDIMNLFKLWKKN